MNRYGRPSPLVAIDAYVRPYASLPLTLVVYLCLSSVLTACNIYSKVDELKGEKIDIVRWSEDLATFITNALSPAKVVQVHLKGERNDALIIVPDDQLSLAIGREGQNVRLAAHLTNCHLDILTESELRKQKMEIQQAAQEKVRNA